MSSLEIYITYNFLDFEISHRGGKFSIPLRENVAFRSTGHVQGAHEFSTHEAWCLSIKIEVDLGSSSKELRKKFFNYTPV